MAVFLDTRGHTKLSIAVCARCGVKYAWDELESDGNSPGLKVCRDGCRDPIDPYRLPARIVEDITLDWARPDDTLSPGPYDVPVLPLQAVLSPQGIGGIASSPSNNDIAIAPPASVLSQPQPWAPQTQYALGSQVTAGVEYGSTVAAAIMPVFLCLVPGLSGQTLPVWPTAFGVMVTDWQVTWICAGFLLP